MSNKPWKEHEIKPETKAEMLIIGEYSVKRFQPFLSDEQLKRRAESTHLYAQLHKFRGVSRTREQGQGK